jgi:hypothetical protein
MSRQLEKQFADFPFLQEEEYVLVTKSGQLVDDATVHTAWFGLAVTPTTWSCFHASHCLIFAQVICAAFILKKMFYCQMVNRSEGTNYNCVVVVVFFLFSWSLFSLFEILP